MPLPLRNGRRLPPQLPAVKPGAPLEPALSPEMYRAILDTLKQMSLVMERSPHAYATMDEETPRFQFLIPLNANFEGEARAEVFNYTGKTDILITVQGKNILHSGMQILEGSEEPFGDSRSDSRIPGLARYKMRHYSIQPESEFHSGVKPGAAHDRRTSAFCHL